MRVRTRNGVYEGTVIYLIIWNRKRKYDWHHSTVEVREELAEEMATPCTLRRIHILNIVINIVVLFAVLFAFGFNLLALGVAFILTDFVLCIIDHLVFVEIPYRKSMNISLTEAQKRLEKIKKEKDIIAGKIVAYQTAHCDKCWICSGECAKYHWFHRLKNERDFLACIIKREESYINSELQKIKTEEIKKDDKTSKEYSDKKEYLHAMKEKIAYFVSTCNMQFLTPVLYSVNLLIETLEKKPIGYNMVPNNLYIHLDELQNILGKLSALDVDKQDIYIKDIEKISEGLSENINSLIARITKIETDDIEVGIAVLLQELDKEGEPENV